MKSGVSTIEVTSKHILVFDLNLFNLFISGMNLIAWHNLPCYLKVVKKYAF